eukprot:3941952-Rhodomonas_salina.4
MRRSVRSETPYYTSQYHLCMRVISPYNASVPVVRQNQCVQQAVPYTTSALHIYSCRQQLQVRTVRIRNMILSLSLFAAASTGWEVGRCRRNRFGIAGMQADWLRYQTRQQQQQQQQKKSEITERLRPSWSKTGVIAGIWFRNM